MILSIKFFVCLFSIVSSNVVALDTRAFNNAPVKFQSNQHEKQDIFSYLNILETYYNDALENSKNLGLVDYSFDDFKTDYYNQSLTIDSFTDSFRNLDFLQTLSDRDNRLENNNRSSVPDAWIDDSSGTPVFSRYPIYNNQNGLYYNLLSAGDILHESRADTTFFVHHVAMINDTNAYLDGCYYIQTIEAMPINGLNQSANGVLYGFLDDQRICQYGLTFYRVSSLTSTQRNGALSFINSQYHYNYDVGHWSLWRNTDTYYNSGWYCSEIIWAAFYSVGINLDGFDPVNPGDNIAILPDDIKNSSLVEGIDIGSCYIKATVVSKGWFSWTISLYNPNLTTMHAEYNSKMCFDNDAATWDTSALTDIVYINIPSLSSVTVVISENWFATTIACSSYVHRMPYGHGQLYTARYITYANNLIANPPSLNERHSYLFSCDFDPQASSLC